MIGGGAGHNAQVYIPNDNFIVSLLEDMDLATLFQNLTWKGGDNQPPGLYTRPMHPLIQLHKSLTHCVFHRRPFLRFLSTLPGLKKDGFIHPTAVVHPNATLGEGVSIGPFCTVGPSVKLGDACKLYPGSHVFGNSILGDSCVLNTGAVVGDDLPGNTVIGSNNTIGHHAVVGVKCQDLKYKTGAECFLEIGDDNEIREYSSIHRSSMPDDKTVIGDSNLIMGSCHIAHDCKIGSDNILANNTLMAGHVIVEDFVHTAGATVIHQHCHLGSFCFVGGGSVVSQDVPRFAMVSGERAELRGLNTEGLRRRGFSVSEIKSLRAAYRKIFMPQSTETQGIEDRLAEVEQNEELAKIPAVSSMVQSIRDSFRDHRRGICRFRHWPMAS